MAQPGIEPKSPGPLANTLTAWNRFIPNYLRVKLNFI